MFLTPKRSLTTLLLIIVPTIVVALQNDRTQKIHIVSDSSTYHSKTGITVFEGHVKAIQGTSHIVADKLTTQAKEHKIQEIVAYGLQNLAHYWTVPTKGEQEVHATAKIIKFYPKETHVTLEKNVHITQGKNSFNGELILYNRQDQTIIVPKTEKGHAVLVYNPDEKSKL